MGDFFKSLGMLAILALLVLVAPVGIAIATTWEPAQTSGLVTGGLTICGGAVAVGALGFGLAAGAMLFRDRRRGEDAHLPAAPSYTVQAPRAELDYWRTQRAMIDAQRAGLTLERDRRALDAPAAAQDWPTASDWQYTDALADHAPQGNVNPW